MSDTIDKLITAAKIAAHLVPGPLAALFCALKDAWLSARYSRLQQFFEEVARRGVSAQHIHEASEADERVLSLLSITLTAALNTHRAEKLRLFARLYASYVRTGTFDNIEKYEDFTHILDDLSYTEFRLLVILADFEKRHSVQPEENEQQRVSKYWEAFKSHACEKLLIPVEQFRGRTERLKRTGLFQGLNASYWNGMNDKGYLTALYDEFFAAFELPSDDSESPLLGS